MKTVVLDTIHRHIEALLAGAITSVNPTFVASYSDVTSSGFTEGVNVGSLNGVTAVDVVGVPAASTRRLVSEIDIFNADTAPVTLTVRYNDNGTTYKIVTVTLAVGAHWVMSEGTGFYTPPATTAINDFQVGNGSGNWITKTLAQVKTILGLGTAAFLNVGTTASLVVQLDGSAKLPAVDGSQLTGISGGSPSVCDGRLTLTSGVPVTTSDVTAATTLYFTPYVGSKIGLYNGATWDIVTFAELSITLASLTANKNYDVFCYNNAGTATLELLVWSSDSARATALVRQDGILCKTGALTRRYLGTIRITNTTGQCEDSSGGTVTQTGGKRFVWNMYNRVIRPLGVIDTTATWAYTTDTIRQANGATGNKVEMVLGLSEDSVSARVDVTSMIYANTATGAKVGIGVDSTTVFSGIRPYVFNASASQTFLTLNGSFEGLLAAGYHYLAWCEKGADTHSTFQGNSGHDDQGGLSARCKA